MIMKIKVDKFSFEMTDKDSQNLLNLLKYFNSLSDKDQLKILTLMLGVPLMISKVSMDIYKTIKEEQRKDKTLDTECKLKLKIKEVKKELTKKEE